MITFGETKLCIVLIELKLAKSTWHKSLLKPVETLKAGTRPQVFNSPNITQMVKIHNYKVAVI